MPNVRLVNVTPALAAKWLEANTANYRRLTESRVVALARYLVEAEWELTGDAIVFDDTGRLLNGQHRLSAIVLAETPATLIVLRGVPSKAQDVMDTGARRNMADALRRRGETDVMVLGAGLSWLHRLAWINRTGLVFYSGTDNRATTPELLSILNEHPDIRESVKLTRRVRSTLKLRPGFLVACHYTLSRIDPSEADVFFGQLEAGVDLASDSPIYALRRNYLRDAQRTTASRRMSAEHAAAILIKAWNFWREGQSVPGLTWHYGGSGREKFPVPK